MQQATGRRVASKWAIQPYQQGYPYQQMPPLGYGQQFPQQYQQGYQQPYQQMPQQQYNPWTQQMPHSLTNSGLKVFNSKCRRCRVLNNQQLK